jgi:hypothetical protein
MLRRKRIEEEKQQVKKKNKDVRTCSRNARKEQAVKHKNMD